MSGSMYLPCQASSVTLPRSGCWAQWHALEWLMACKHCTSRCTDLCTMPLLCSAFSALHMLNRCALMSPLATALQCPSASQSCMATSTGHCHSFADDEAPGVLHAPLNEGSASVAPADTAGRVCRGGVRVENAPEARRGARLVNGYAEDMQLFNGPLPLPPPAFDAPPQVISHIWMCAIFRSWPFATL